jgi:soluble cytochrome b562
MKRISAIAISVLLCSTAFAGTTSTSKSEDLNGEILEPIKPISNLPVDVDNYISCLSKCFKTPVCEKLSNGEIVCTNTAPFFDLECVKKCDSKYAISPIISKCESYLEPCIYGEKSGHIPPLKECFSQFRKCVFHEYIKPVLPPVRSLEELYNNKEKLVGKQVAILNLTYYGWHSCEGKLINKAKTKSDILIGDGKYCMYISPSGEFNGLSKELIGTKVAVFGTLTLDNNNLYLENAIIRKMGEYKDINEIIYIGKNTDAVKKELKVRDKIKLLLKKKLLDVVNKLEIKLKEKLKDINDNPKEKEKIQLVLQRIEQIKEKIQKGDIPRAKQFLKNHPIIREHIKEYLKKKIMKYLNKIQTKYDKYVDKKDIDEVKKLYQEGKIKEALLKIKEILLKIKEKIKK